MDNTLKKAMTHVVLVGAGHAHVEVLRRFRTQPEPSVRITLVTKSIETPYSGMVPGFVAGHYAKSEINIRVDRLANFPSCQALYGRAVRFDAGDRRVLLDDGRELVGDLVSIDIGAVTDLSAAPKNARMLVAVKPMDEFEKHWPGVERQLIAVPDIGIAVIGAGAAGVELALAIRQRLQLQQAHSTRTQHAKIVLLEQGQEILPGFSKKARGRLTRILGEQSVEIRTGFSGFGENDSRNEFAVLVWAAGVRPASWLKSSGLAADAQGFIAVNRHLQSVSHPAVFAAGDIAAMVETPRSKSGVMAVRQGPILAENLRRAARGRTLKCFTPQKRWLSIILAGERYAVAIRGGWTVEGRWVWIWKNWLDTSFIRRFSF